MDDPTWLALTLVLTVVGAVLAVLAYRRRGLALALRVSGVTLLAPAAYLTDTLPLLLSIGEDIGRWATGLVLSPVVWTGVGLAGVGVLLFLAGGSLMARGRGITPGRSAEPAAAEGGGRRPLPAQEKRTGRRPSDTTGAEPGAGPGARADEGLDDDIEAILRRRGIQ